MSDTAHQLRRWSILVESPSVDAHHNPRTGEQYVGLLKVLDVLVSG